MAALVGAGGAVALSSYMEVLSVVSMAILVLGILVLVTNLKKEET